MNTLGLHTITSPFLVLTHCYAILPSSSQYGLFQIFPSDIYLFSLRPSRTWQTLVYTCNLRDFLYQFGVWKVSFLAKKNK